jgi:hypothetical protein
MGRWLVSLKIIKEALSKEKRIIMTKKSDGIVDITTVLLALLLLGIAAGTASVPRQVITYDITTTEKNVVIQRNSVAIKPSVVINGAI